MRTNILTEEELNENSRMNIKPGDYEIFSVNETVLDRTYKHDLKIEDKHFNCIAHYIQYQKCQTWGLSHDICDYILYKYAADYPIKTTKDYINFEDEFNNQYAMEIKSIPDQYRAKWREECPIVTAEAVLSAYEQSDSFKKALLDTKRTLIVELSPSILWGIDTESFSSDITSNPINWRGENLYGQVLMGIRNKYRPSLFAKIKRMMTEL